MAVSDYEAETRQQLATEEGRIKAITERAYSRRYGVGNTNYIRECADDEYELLGFLANAQAQHDEMARMAAQMCNDYAWLLVQCNIYGPKWDQCRIVDGNLVTYGDGILEMARNRFRYQSEDHEAAFAAMRAIVPPNTTGE